MPAPSLRIRRIIQCSFLTVILGLAITLGLSACSAGISENVPTDLAKIGLIAPFEGRYREIGIDVIPAARLAIQEWAQRPEAKDLVIELVAYDDRGSEGAARDQANRLLQDDDVEVVVGHWLGSTTNAALPLYVDRGIPLIAFTHIPDDYTQRAFTFDSVPFQTEIIEAEIGEAVDSPELADIPAARIDGLLEADNLVSSEPQILAGDSRLATRQLASLLGNEFTTSNFIVSSEGLASVQDDVYWSDDTIADFQPGFESNSLGAPPGLFSRNAYLATWLAIVWIADSHGLPIVGTPIDNIDYQNTQYWEGPYFVYQWQDSQLQLVKKVP